jgi:hypothetical protein
MDSAGAELVVEDNALEDPSPCGRRNWREWDRWTEGVAVAWA